MNRTNRQAFLIAAPKSNSGKTMVTLGLMHALVKRGVKVQPFKCGPDYIDPMHHSIIAGRPSYNLDVWMSSQQHVSDIFRERMLDADVGVAEGVMGLFDGACKDEGSSASIARLLDLPVILVVDASSVAYSVAPLLYGFKNFDKSINLVGVIFNKVAGESHYTFLKEAAEAAQIPSLGYLPRDPRLAIESRHLGLHMPGESDNFEIVESASQLLEKHVDIDTLLEMTQISFDTKSVGIDKGKGKITTAIAHDDAFGFTYQANLDALKSVGDVITFSPIKDKEVPSADLLWLPGGYPELFASHLSQNKSMLQSVKRHIEEGKAVVAECGGMMYLGKSIHTKDGDEYSMVGILPHTTSFENMKLHLGYRKIDLEDFQVKGHEFHYSHLTGEKGDVLDADVYTARGRPVEMPVFKYKNCWASYMHLYLGDPQKLNLFLKSLNLDI